MNTYEGIYVPLVTPFKNGDIDWESLGQSIEYYISVGVAGIVPCGSTGECCTLSHDEHNKVIQFSVEQVAGRIKVVAGTGSNSTYEAIKLSQAAEQAGADAVLVVSPYYNRPSQEGIYQYFADVAASVNIDVILYNIPARTGSNISVDTVVRLSEIANIKGIKEGSGDIQQMTDLAHHFYDQDFAILTGEDTLLYQLSTLGGNGGIMAAACVYPEQLIKVHQLVRDGKSLQASELDRLLRPVIKALFLEANPVVVKYAVSLKLDIPYELRKPLLPVTESNRQRVEAAMRTVDSALSNSVMPV
ncbi:4-hydroxy-tetrahydrodipicolinate synthase [Photobacterium gaetbulicola]|uniref:4-hydroxy-tetrahydrodipicolinate synthase n=1 Tax=Photobacterium gaetbulicola Gung47 TaxID=658445 RepID=A0A0C5WC24_9GAMM|nr:4-hydroxy-tetrahydrodipicolinate synthase [Photobacterium gaetbulicola]AJR09196.1 putative Dihydrodipicolinate synthase/N-acetylneuraminate lyase [Photobacterium gaetbulicola Gung47]PSU11754.1 4-hydroxy-tetrahydrodipicolinate synthase [Photobacterium gaetbulicola]